MSSKKTIPLNKSSVGRIKCINTNVLGGFLCGIIAVVITEILAITAIIADAAAAAAAVYGGKSTKAGVNSPALHNAVHKYKK